MMERTTDAEMVNAVFREALERDDFDLTKHAENPDDFIFTDDGGVVVFRKGRPGEFIMMLAVSKDQQGKGIGSRLSREGVRWMFANTQAEALVARIYSHNPVIKSVAFKVKGTQVVSAKRCLLLRLTREAWEASQIASTDNG